MNCIVLTCPACEAEIIITEIKDKGIISCSNCFNEIGRFSKTSKEMDETDIYVKKIINIENKTNT